LLPLLVAALLALGGEEVARSEVSVCWCSAAIHAGEKGA
jgi:hypothetical protein